MKAPCEQHRPRVKTLPSRPLHQNSLHQKKGELRRRRDTKLGHVQRRFSARRKCELKLCNRWRRQANAKNTSWRNAMPLQFSHVRNSRSIRIFLWKACRLSGRLSRERCVLYYSPKDVSVAHRVRPQACYERSMRGRRLFSHRPPTYWDRPDRTNPMIPRCIRWEHQG